MTKISERSESTVYWLKDLSSTYIFCILNCWLVQTLWALRCNLLLTPWGIIPTALPDLIANEHSSRQEGAWAPETGKEAYVLCPQPRRLGIWLQQNRKMTDLEAVCRSAACLWGIHSSILPVHSFWSTCCQHGQTKPIYWCALFRLSYSFVRQRNEASESA